MTDPFVFLNPYAGLFLLVALVFLIAAAWEMRP